MIYYGSAYSFCYFVCEQAKVRGIARKREHGTLYGVYFTWSNGAAFQGVISELQDAFVGACKALATSLTLDIAYDPKLKGNKPQGRVVYGHTQSGWDSAQFFTT
jgi:hypothetical protein